VLERESSDGGLVGGEEGEPVGQRRAAELHDVVQPSCDAADALVDLSPRTARVSHQARVRCHNWSMAHCSEFLLVQVCQESESFWMGSCHTAQAEEGLLGVYSLRASNDAAPLLN